MVAIRFPTLAKAVHRLVDACLKEEHKRRHAWASRPEGPAEPWVCSDESRIASWFNASNRMKLVESWSSLLCNWTYFDTCYFS